MNTRRREALEKSGDGDRTDLVGILSGAVEVHGPGVKLVVNDAKDVGGAGADGQAARHLRVLRHRPGAGPGHAARGQRSVESGAEAISINGQRRRHCRRSGPPVTRYWSTTQAAGAAVHGARGGGRRAAEQGFQDSADGLYLHALEESYGIRTAISVADDLKLPAAPARCGSRTAQPITEKGTS